MSQPGSLKRNLELDPRQEILDCLLLTLVLVLTKADYIAEERSCKWDTVGIKGAGDIDMILALLEDVLGGLRVWDDWLQPGRTSLCRTLSLFLGALGGGCGKDWASYIACG